MVWMAWYFCRVIGLFKNSMVSGVLLLCVAVLGTVGFEDGVLAQRRRAPRVIQLEEIHIEGKVQKPNAFYVLNRSNIGYEVLDLRTSFVREIRRSVRRSPF